MSDVDIRISYLFVRDDVVDEDAVKLFVKSLKYLSMKDELVISAFKAIVIGDDCL